MHIDWDEYFVGIALLSAKRSKDPHTQVGACIVNTSNQIVGVGYNGMPRGCPDSNLHWARDGESFCNKHMFVVHAELNAILNSTVNLRGCQLYTTLFPCNECTKAIIQSGIKHIIYLHDKYSHTDAVKASKHMLGYAGVSYRQFTTTKSNIILDFAIY